jgi:hemerythrin-like domain-containing protein
MKPTEILKEEHKEIRRMLKILGSACEKLKKGEEVERDVFEKIIEFIKVFADQCHHGKEEDLLFPAMEIAGIPKESGPIGVMLFEHNVGREAVRGMKEGIEEFFNGNERARKKIIDNAEKYIELLDSHIFKEDNILYPMADMHLSEEQQKELLEKFEEVEKKIGEGVHHSFIELVENLEKYFNI